MATVATVATGRWIRHGAELWVLGPHPGPTGEYVAVTRGEVRDNGGNVLFAGAASRCVGFRRRCRVPTRLVPTQWVRSGPSVIRADHTWQLVAE